MQFRVEARILPENEQEELKTLIVKFPSVFTDIPEKLTYASHDVAVGDAKSIKQHPYRVNPTKLKVICEEVKYMLENSIIEPSSSQWSSPCVLVPKTDGSYRFCTDFCRLNAVTKIDSFPLPRIDERIDCIGHARYVSKFDLLKGYGKCHSQNMQRSCQHLLSLMGCTDI